MPPPSVDRRRTTGRPTAPQRAVAASRARPRLTPRDRRRASERRFRQTIVKVDLWSVLKLSLCFYLSAMFVTLVALVALWVIADAAGVIGERRELPRRPALGEGLHSSCRARCCAARSSSALVVVALQVVITVIAASFYNIFAELFGGLEITVREEEAPPRR